MRGLVNSINNVNTTGERAADAAGRDAVVLALGDLRTVATWALPESLADLVWNALTVVQDAQFRSVMAWHMGTARGGVSGS
jgi:hypothetical protein